MTNIERFQKLLHRYVVLLEALNKNYIKNQEVKQKQNLPEKDYDAQKLTYTSNNDDDDATLIKNLTISEIPGVEINETTKTITFDVISGAGHRGDKVQKYIEGFDNFAPFGTIYISVGVQGQGYIGEKSNFLHWGLTHNNIVAEWGNDSNSIKSLKIQNTDISISKNNLSSNNQEVENFYNAYCKLSTYLFLLKDRYNIVYTGAPGTGKTYLAKEMAAYLTNIKSYHELNDKQKEQIGFVQFHPSYDYTDFVEGLRPDPVTTTGGNVGFTRTDGVFKKFCKKALQDWKEEWNKQKDNLKPDNIKEINDATLKSESLKRYVFIIDEINRGELSKIFGELFYSIDPGYRGESGKVATQYQNLINIDPETTKDDVFKNGFYVPKNVYIIGTMNEIDRSVEPMDFAVRRRFVWINVTPEERTDMWGDEAWKPNSWGPEARICMNNINKVIRSIETLGDNYCLGPAYFNNPPLTNENKLDKDDLWEIRIKSLVQEYLRVLPATEANDYLKVIKVAYDTDKEIVATEYEKIKGELAKKSEQKKSEQEE